MHISQEADDANTVVLTVTAGEAELEPIRVHTLGHFVKQVKIPGFRAGKAPLNLIEKHVDQQKFLEEFMEHAVNELYNRALVHQKLRAVMLPQIEIKKFVPFSQLEFTAKVNHVKIGKLANYKQFKFDKPPVEITAEDVGAVIKSLRQRAAQRTKTDQPAKAGNEIIIDFTAKDKQGKAIHGATGQDYPLLLGSKAFIPGFEDQLLGLKAGDTKQFKLTFPKDYQVATLAGKPVSFDVTVKTVNLLYDSAPDDAFAAKVSPFTTLAELKADIKKQLLAERRVQANRDLESRIVQRLIAESELTIPEQLVEEQLERREADEKRNLATKGITWQDHLEQEGVSGSEHRERQRGDAERDIKAGILLGEVCEAEGIDVSEEDLAVRTQLLKGQNPDPAFQIEIEKPEVQRDLRSRLLTEKTLAKLVGYATK